MGAEALVHGDLGHVTGEARHAQGLALESEWRPLPSGSYLGPRPTAPPQARLYMCSLILEGSAARASGNDEEDQGQDECEYR